MEKFWQYWREEGFTNAIQVLDVLVVAGLIYLLMSVVRGARAWRLIFGICIYFGVWWLSGVLGLQTLHFLLDKALVLGPVALVILFLPELRAALEGFGRFSLLPERLSAGDAVMDIKLLEEIVGAVSELSANKTGALIVIERSRELSEVAETGIMMEAHLSAPLLCALFHGSNPLHDGAVLVRRGKIVAAGCRLPLTEARLPTHLHLRHAAAVGITEISDALAVVVSEERGVISVALDGRLREEVSPAKLRELLHALFREGSSARRRLFPGARKKGESVSV